MSRLIIVVEGPDGHMAPKKAKWPHDSEESQMTAKHMAPSTGQMATWPLKSKMATWPSKSRMTTWPLQGPNDRMAPQESQMATWALEGPDIATWSFEKRCGQRAL